MGNNQQTFSREDALDVRTFFRLFVGALRIENKQQRIRTVIIILCAGRLGMRASEIQHLHEGWINWKDGVIRIPAHDPCFCKWCLNKAVGKIANKKDIPESEVSRDDQAVVEYAYQHQYEPKPNASARVVPFGWSKRITAWLLHFFKDNEFVDLTQQQMRDDVRKAARLAEGVDPSNLTLHPLRSTGATFYADAGLLSKPHRDLMGWSGRTQARRYVRGSGRQLTADIYKLFGRSEWAPDVVPEDPGEKFPLACDPRPLAAEIDVDPRQGDPTARRDRAAELADQKDPLYNPRRTRRPGGISYDPEQHDIPGHIDPNGPGLEDPDVKRVPMDADLREWVGYYNEQTAQSEASEERRKGLFDFDEEGTVDPVTVAKVAYVTCLIVTSWSATLGPLV